MFIGNVAVYRLGINVVTVSSRDARIEASGTTVVWCYASGPAQLWMGLALRASRGSLL